MSDLPRTLAAIAGKTLIFLCLGAASAQASAGLEAFDSGFPVQNEAALAQSFALPPLGTPRVLAPGHSQYRATLDWINEFVVDNTGTESLTEDGETQRYRLDLRHGFETGGYGNFELGLTLPVVVNNGGVLDGIIGNYHKVFGFPNGGRPYAPHDRLLYQYTRNGNALLNVDRSGTGVGDLALSAGWQVKPDLALRAMLKLPTGDSAHLTGGNTGGAVWLDFDPRINPDSDWFGFLSLGGSYNATSDVLPQYQRHAILLGGGGIGYHITDGFSLQAQAYVHSPLYKHTAEPSLHRMGLQGAFGGRYAFSPHVAVEAGFQEDLITTSSPDFSIHLGIVLR